MIGRLIVAALTLCLPAMSTAAPDTSEQQCRSIRGLDALWQKPLRWIVVGEQHGTNEMPAAFLDIVCNAAATKGPIVVALERWEAEQADLDVYMKSDGGTAARTALLRSGTWGQKQMQDGRGSLAYLQLIESLRQMKKAGAITSVVLFVPDLKPTDARPFSPANYEQQMADRLIKASAAKNALVLAYVGNCHAMRLAMCGNKPAAAFLPPAETFTINIEGTRGSVWNCGGGCGVHQVAGFSPKGTPKLDLLTDPKAPYDAILLLGGPVSASPPAAAKMDPSAAQD